MELKDNINLPLDKFINLSLYDKKHGYYMKKNPFGEKGDFITAPNISRLFSEMIAIWILSFWQSLGSPKKFNLIELGAGNGVMMKVLIDSFKSFPVFSKSCNIFIHEKSNSLIKIQKKNLKKSKIVWLSSLDHIKKNPSIFIANEFFDSIAIKQFQKKGDSWFEKFVKYKKDESQFFEKKIDIEKIEKKINYKISKNQNFIEYSEEGLKYLENISNIINQYSGGLLLIDYGYTDKKMKNTLQATYKHKFSNILKNIGNSDITHNINFNFFEKIIGNWRGLKTELTNQKNFLLEMGIQERAEIIAKKESFLKKADIYYRIKRLTDEKQMGKLFKVMLVKNEKNNFKLGFKN